MRSNPDVTGMKIGRLTLVERLNVGGHIEYRCQCDCGGQRIDTLSSIKARGSGNPGCKFCKGERISQAAIARGTSSRLSGTTRKHRLYRTWVAMKVRCSGSDKQARRNYYDKGIRVCEQWQEFENFRKWALENGYDSHLTIERKNPNLGYSPSNCEWVTKSFNSWTANSYRKGPLYLNWESCPAMCGE